MGQGTDSCGGYEVDYDEYEEALDSGVWIMRNGERIQVSKMTVTHLHNAKRVVKNLAACETFSGDADKWQQWVEVFDSEIAARQTKRFEPVEPKQKFDQFLTKQETRGLKVKMKCHCGVIYQARKADINRGWGLSCSKRCASIRREYGKPAAKEVKQ